MSRSILLVEDNSSDEKLALLAFRRNGITQDIVISRDGADALEFLHGEGRHSGRDTSLLPTVILLDLKLPRIDGLEVLRRIRAHERTRLLVVVVLTASIEAEDISRSYAFGANAYVRKPVDFKEFTDTVKTLGSFWLGLNQPPPPRRES